MYVYTCIPLFAYFVLSQLTVKRKEIEREKNLLRIYIYIYTTIMLTSNKEEEQGKKSTINIEFRLVSFSSFKNLD